MAYYLGNVTIGTVLVGVTSDNSTANFSSARDALTALGVSVEDVKQGGSFAFVAQVGYSSRTMINKSLSHYDTAAALYVSLFGEMTTYTHYRCTAIANSCCQGVCSLMAISFFY
jgi:hypothetical protein